MIDFKKMSETELKIFASAQKIGAFEDADLVSFFAIICNRIFKYEGSVKVENVAEHLFWKAALEIINAEMYKRNLSVSYVGITKGYEAESIMDLLDNPKFDIEIETVISALDIQTLYKVEKAFVKAAEKEPKKFIEPLLIIQSEIQQRTILMN